MKNFIFKSDKGLHTDLYKILIKLDLLLTEQRHQRGDLHQINKNLKKIIPEPLEVMPDDISDSLDGE